MSWLATKIAFKKSWIWLKEHWQVPFMVAWTVAVWVVSRRNSQAVVEVLEAKKKSYKEQIDTLKKTHSDELLARDALIEKYKETVEKVQRDFKHGKLRLTNNQKEEIKKFVLESKGNPDEIKEKIESTFGFTYVD